VFLDLATMEPHDDQWAFLSSLGRMTPGELNRITRRTGRLVVGNGVDRLDTPVSTRIRAAPTPILHARLGARIRLETGELTPALHATVKHAASMRNPIFSERQRLRMSTGRCRDFCGATPKPSMAGSSCRAASLTRSPR
jgi:hypothetical protein